MRFNPKDGWRLDIAGLTYQGLCVVGTFRSFRRFLAMEMAKESDTSILYIFRGVQVGWLMREVYLCGLWNLKTGMSFHPLQKLEKMGGLSFDRTEVGSGCSWRMTTTCKREGDVWILNGKRSGSATADLLRYDDPSGLGIGRIQQVKGFIVRKGKSRVLQRNLRITNGFRTSKMPDLHWTNCESTGNWQYFRRANSFSKGHLLKSCRLPSRSSLASRRMCRGAYD